MLQYVFLALGLIASLWLFFTLKCEIQAHARKQRQKLEEVHRKVAEAQPETVIVPAGPRPGFNISRRAQALRMLRHGEDIAHISAALGMPRREVELLVRVHEIVQQASLRR